LRFTGRRWVFRFFTIIHPPHSLRTAFDIDTLLEPAFSSVVVSLATVLL
jgi:hypothetical protein